MTIETRVRSQGTFLTIAGAVIGYIPYTGATGNVDLGLHNLTVDSPTFFVDSVNHRVGIGTTSPGSKLEVNGSIAAGDGTVSLPSFTFAGDTNTGLYWIGSGTVGVTANGTSIWRIEADGNMRVGGSGAAICFGAIPTSNDVNLYRAGAGKLYLGNGTAGNYTGTLIAGNVGIGLTAPTAVLHLKAGTATASTAPLKFTSGVSLTTAEAGAIEFTTDDFYATITTGAARKGVVLNDGTNLTSGKIPIASTNGRLIDGQTPLVGTKIYYVADSSGGAVTRKLTFIDGILTAET